MHKPKLFTTIILIASISLSHAQNISNIDFTQKGQFIEITYKLSGLAYNEQADISVYVSANGGESFIGPLKEMTGDVGDYITNGKKTISWEVFKEMPDFSGNIVFDIRAKVNTIDQKNQYYIAYTASPEAPLGITLGVLNRYGLYLSARINPAYFTAATFNTDGENITNYNQPGYYIFSGNQSKKRLALTLGLSRQLTKNIHLYAGVGFSDYALLWEVDQFSYEHTKTGTDFAEHTTESFSSFELEAGVKAKFSKLIFSVGASTPAFNWYEFTGSIGYVF